MPTCRGQKKVLDSWRSYRWCESPIKVLGIELKCSMRSVSTVNYLSMLRLVFPNIIFPRELQMPDSLFCLPVLHEMLIKKTPFMIINDLFLKFISILFNIEGNTFKYFFYLHIKVSKGILSRSLKLSHVPKEMLHIVNF